MDIASILNTFKKQNLNNSNLKAPVFTLNHPVLVWIQSIQTIKNLSDNFIMHRSCKKSWQLKYCLNVTHTFHIFTGNLDRPAKIYTGIHFD